MNYETCYIKIRKENNGLYLAMNEELELHFFNETSIKILNLIEQNLNKKEIVQILIQEYDVDIIHLKEDVDSAIQYMLDNRFIRGDKIYV